MTLDVFPLSPVLTTPGLMETGLTKVDVIRMTGDLITKMTKEEAVDLEAVVVVVAEVMEAMVEVAMAVEAVEHQEEVLLIPSILTGSALQLKLLLSQTLIG